MPGAIDITKVRRYIIYDFRNRSQSLVEADWDMQDMHLYISEKGWTFHIMDVNYDGSVNVYVQTGYDIVAEEALYNDS